MTGWLREGEIRIGDRITIPMKDGQNLYRVVGGLDVFYRSVKLVHASDLEEQIGVAIWDGDDNWLSGNTDKTISNVLVEGIATISRRKSGQE